MGDSPTPFLAALGADVQPNKKVFAIGAGTALLAASLIAPSAARAYRAWEVERRQALIAAAIDAARRGDDSLPSIPLADPDAQVAGSSDGVTDSADPEAGERDDAALRAAYVAAELGIRTPQFNAELGRIAPSNPSVLYVGLGDASDQQFGGWAKSVDGGTTWTTAQILTAVHPADNVTVFAQQVREVTADPNDANHVFFTTDAGLFVTTDGGATFTIATLPKSAPYTTSREGTWSIAWLGGTSWIASGVYACPGFNGPNVGLQIFGATSCPAPNVTVPGNRGDIWWSADNGLSWTSVRDSDQFAALIAAAGASGIGRMDLAV